MGIENIEFLIDKGESMEAQGGDPAEEPQKDESQSQPSEVDPNRPAEKDDDRKDESPSPPQPVDNPDLSEDGDPDDEEDSEA